MPKLPKLPKPLERNLEAIDKVPLLERKREIVAGMAKERQKGGQGGVLLVENLPQATDKTRDSIAAEIVAGQAKERQGERTDICQKSDNSEPLDTKREIAKAAEIVAGMAKERQGEGESISRWWRSEIGLSDF